MNCLKEYLKIFEQYPLIDKRFKEQRNIALHNWQVNKDDYPLLKSQVCGFIRENKTIMNAVFIERAVCPLMNDCFTENEYAFINELIQTVGIDESQKISIRDIIYIYCEYIQWKKSPIQIVNEIMRHINSQLLLEFKFNVMQNQIYYSVHELPVGILETDILSMQNCNEVFNEFEKIAKILDKKTDIDKIKIVYDAYFNYLNGGGKYSSFEEYLNKNNIDYECLIYR